MSHTCEHTHDHDHDHTPDVVATRLQAAQVRVADAGERMTSSRLRTYELILEANAPIKAYDVIDRFHPDGAAKPPTVYRALSFLEQMGLIHRIESLNAFVACDTHDHSFPNGHTAAFLLCECCGQSEEIAIPSLPDVETRATQTGFLVNRVTLEVRGLCHACRETH
ncbi:Fur family transcriptional regulator [Asticcacaulis sp. 201]|uniref:Fur family transcriptional regulator n=1 Tax=Asticcacaulis sp. 201 TaxID=3028787 RepID=UPI00291603EF|nr:Fur family transcriptional regulator [Asticcacaulis sp. 201]MDV6332449.1 Fur family transcriptional regulator [Asticcacaulis sp. 201]